MKKVLIITYYWPPSGGAGVQRWLKFAKYLREYGWEPVIYTPENPEPPDFDDSLLKDIPENITVIKKPVWEPYSLYRRFTGKKKEARITHGFLKEKKGSGILEKFSVWIRGNFFIPDARCFWIRPSVKFLSRYLRDNPVDAVVSSGPPHSMHLIALGLKKKLNVKWLADFRDPWTEIDFFNKLRLSKLALNKHRRLERAVLSSADAVVTVSRQWARDLNRLGAKDTQVITNGFDPEDFSFMPVEVDEAFLLTHIGSLNADRNPDILWQSLAELCNENEKLAENLQLRFIGRNDISLKESLEKHNLLHRTDFIDYLPHEEALRLAAKSSVLLLLLNNTPNQMGIIPGKTFEYLALEKPILCIGPTDGASANLLKETNAGVTCGFKETEKMKGVIRSYFHQWINEPDEEQIININSYSRKSLTSDLSVILNTL